MGKILIKGGEKLVGKVKLAGNKNSALKLMAASLLAKTPTTLTNVPRIRDVLVMGEIIQKLGAKVDGIGTRTLTIDPESINSYKIDPLLSERIRASVVLVAPLLVRFGKAILTPPGGDQIGERLLDTHFSMMQALGVKIKKVDASYLLSWQGKGKRRIFLEEASVTATEMALMLTASQNVEVKIDDVACEPHVEELAVFLNKAGAEISGAGTNTVFVSGKKNLRGITHKVSPDYIEGGTFAVAAAITNGDVLIEDFVDEHYQMILHYLGSMGVNFKKDGKNGLRILPSRLIASKRKFQTRPWPGFPTDLMSPFIVLATQTQGTVLCHDWMYEWRVFFVDDLISMGANIFIADPHRVIVTGPTKLYADALHCKDIRAGISILIAALAAKGESTIDHIEIIERGYEKVEERLKSLGAKIKSVKE